MDLDDADLALINSVRKRHRYGRLLEALLAAMVMIYALGAGILYRQWDALRLPGAPPFEALRLHVRAGHFYGMSLCALLAVFHLSLCGSAASRRRSDALILKLADQCSGFPDHSP